MIPARPCRSDPESVRSCRPIGVCQAPAASLSCRSLPSGAFRIPPFVPQPPRGRAMMLFPPARGVFPIHGTGLQPPLLPSQRQPPPPTAEPSRPRLLAERRTRFGFASARTGPFVGSATTTCCGPSSDFSAAPACPSATRKASTPIPESSSPCRFPSASSAEPKSSRSSSTRRSTRARFATGSRPSARRDWHPRRPADRPQRRRPRSRLVLRHFRAARPHRSRAQRIALVLAGGPCWVERTKPTPRRLDIRPFLRDLRLDRATGFLEMDLWLFPAGTARPEEVLAILGLEDLLEAGAVLERVRLEMEDENRALDRRACRRSKTHLFPGLNE